MAANITNILFYSKYDEGVSESFMKLLHSNNLLSKFKTICIDITNNKEYDTKMENMIRKYNLKNVPAIYFMNNGKPDYKEGTAAFEWLQGIIYLTKQNSDNIQRQQTTRQNVGPMGFRNTEMTGLSDSYAYTQTDEAQPKYFMKYGDDEQNAIYTAPLDGKINDRETKNRIREIEVLRKDQDAKLKDNMKRQQIEAIIKAEQDKMNIKY